MGGRSIDVCEWCGGEAFDDIPCCCCGATARKDEQDVFTIDEIREWLEGWYLLDSRTRKRVDSLDLSTILTLLECDQDGIAACRRRRAMEGEEA